MVARGERAVEESVGCRTYTAARVPFSNARMANDSGNRTLTAWTETVRNEPQSNELRRRAPHQRKKICSAACCAPDE